MDRKEIVALLVEQSPDDALLTRKMLANAQGTTCNLEWVDCIESGLQRIKQGGIDVVLLGLERFETVGLDPLRRLRAEAPESLAVVVLSGQRDEQLAVQALQAGAQDCLVKEQVNGNLLIRSLRYAVERQEALCHARAELERKVLERTAKLASASLCPQRNICSSPQTISDPIGPTIAQRAPTFHEQLLDNLYDGVYFVDTDRRITYWNKGAEHLTGFLSSEVVGKVCSENILMHSDESGSVLCFGPCPLAKTMIDGQSREADVYLHHKFGHRVPVCVRVAPIVDSANRIVGAVEVFSDGSAKKKMEQRAGELERIAFTDALTGVANRRYIQFKIEQAVQEVEEFGREIGLLMFDLDEFKLVNDVYGHEVGDRVLQAVSKTLTQSLRPNDLVGRWGGEEFLVLVKAIQGSMDEIAERCRRLIAQSPVPVGTINLQITASVGATVIRQGDSAGSAIRRVDELMYKSKAAGRNRTSSD